MHPLDPWTGTGNRILNGIFFHRGRKGRGGGVYERGLILIKNFKGP